MTSSTWKKLLVENLSEDMYQVSAHAMMQNESYERITGLFGVYRNYLIHAKGPLSNIAFFLQ